MNDRIHQTKSPFRIGRQRDGTITKICWGRKRHSALAFLGLIALSASAPAAELGGATLQAENSAGAESCPTAEELKARTLALGTLRAPLRPPLLIHIEFRREGEHFFATVRTAGRVVGVRELSAAGPSCEPLVAATAVVLGVLLDSRPREEEELLPVRESAPEAAPKPRPFRYAALSAHADGAFGVLGPAFGAAFAADARVRMSRFELMAGGFWFLDRVVDLPPGHVRVGLAGGNLGFCGYFAQFGRAELGSCASLRLGRFRAAGEGFYVDREDASLWSGVAAGVTLGVELSPHWAFRLGVDVVVPIRQHTLTVERVGVAYDASPLAGMLSFGPELRIR